MLGLALVAALGQAPVVSQYDEGVVIGRVCDDLDGDGRCGASEPGVGGARVLLETGQEALTDLEGRFHVAAVWARAAEAALDRRLAPGRHRLKVDPSSLAPGWAQVDRGVTVEVPMGGAVHVELPLRRGEAQSTPTPSSTPPTFRGARASLEHLLRFDAPPEETLSIDGSSAPAEGAWVRLSPGANDFTIALSREGQVRLWRLTLDVIERRASALVVPRPLVALGQVSWASSGALSVKAEAALEVSVDGAAITLDAAGRGAAQVSGTETRLQLAHRGRTWSEALRRTGAQGFFAIGLLDLQANVDVRTGAFSVFGRGAGTARAAFAGFRLGVDVDLRDADLATLQPVALLQARRLDVFARQLDPLRTQLAWADDGATVASNPGENRFRVELSREGWGRLGYGSTRWFQAQADAGRAHRALQGAFVELKTPTSDSPFGAELGGVAAPAQADALTGWVRRPMHERFESTGGSLFFLSRDRVVAGSEAVRIEWRDAVTGLPVRDVHLQRLRDYTLEALSGRLLLARPLSFFVGDSLLQGDPLTAGLTPVLVVDYEYVDTAGPAAAVLGGELRARLGPVTASGSYLRDGQYGLLRFGAQAKLGPVFLSAESARSQGTVEGLVFSRDGGLTPQLRPASDPAAEGWAVTLRARSRGLFGKGHWDAAWRWRQAGFEDVAQVGALNQVSVRGEQPLGPVVLAALVDFRDLPDPRAPLSGQRVVGRTLAGGVGWESAVWGVRLEVREFQQTFSEGARGALTVGLAGRYRVTPWLQLRAGYRQQLVDLGGMEQSFASLGVDVTPKEGLEVGLRGGWGPGLGPQVWGTASWSRGSETWYGVHAIDADAPGAGERRFVTGVRQAIDPATSVFVEDVSATDVAGLRLARAVGVTQRLDDALTVSARYEHGARSLEGFSPDVARNAGGLTVAWERDAVRLFARGEVRDEVGAVPLTQWVATGGGEWRVHRDVSLSARALWTHATRSGRLADRALDATAAFAWRAGPFSLLGRYAYQQRWSASLDSRLHVVSLLPTVRWGDRFTLGAGAHLGLTTTGPILSGSIRPAVRVWQGIEVAAEAAARTSAPEGGSWASLRGEVGYRFDHRFFLGAGYNAFGFSGTGLDDGAPGSRDRVYLRTELAF